MLTVLFINGLRMLKTITVQSILEVVAIMPVMPVMKLLLKILLISKSSYYYQRSIKDKYTDIRTKIKEIFQSSY